MMKKLLVQKHATNTLNNVADNSKVGNKSTKPSFQH